MSQKYRGVCIFGYDEENNGIRPIIVNKSGELEEIEKNYIEEYSIKPFTQVEFDLIQHLPQPPHTEDWVMNKDHQPKIIRILSEDEERKFLEKLKQISYNTIQKSLWGAPIYWHEGKERNTPFIKIGEGKRSIVTIKIKGKNFTIKHYERPEKPGKYEYRIEFSDIHKKNYDLSITDLAFRKYCDSLREQGKECSFIEAELQQKLSQGDIFLRIGAGRPFDPTGEGELKCFLFITGIYSFPDYKK